MKRLLTILFLLCLPAWAQPPAPDQALHDQLRAMKDRCVQALNAGDFDSVIQLADEEIVFTGMDARLAHGRGELKAYFEKMLKGPGKVVESFTTSVEVDRLTTLYGPDFGVASGTTTSQYKLADGTQFEIKNRWTATVVRKNGNWLLASFHSSANVFDNPILDIAKKYSWMLAAASALVCLLIGLVIGRVSKKAA